MNILVLAWDFPPTPRMPGPSRLFNLCRELARRHRVTLAHFRRTMEREAAFTSDAETKTVFQELVTLPSAEELGLPPMSWLNRQLHRATFEPYFSLRRLARPSEMVPAIRRPSGQQPPH